MIRIAFTGPESSGKTTLAKAVSTEMQGTYVAEYARTYLEEYGPEYEVEDLDSMVQGHLESIQNTKSPLQLVDSDFVVFQVWSEYKYDAASPLIYRLVSENWFDLHVLCAPDIPWEPDVLRENPNDRDELFLRYVTLLEKFRKPYIIVEGAHEKRVKKAVAAIQELQRIS